MLIVEDCTVDFVDGVDAILLETEGGISVVVPCDDVFADVETLKLELGKLDVGVVVDKELIPVVDEVLDGVSFAAVDGMLSVVDDCEEEAESVVDSVADVVDVVVVGDDSEGVVTVVVVVVVVPVQLYSLTSSMAMSLM